MQSIEIIPTTPEFLKEVYGDHSPGLVSSSFSPKPHLSYTAQDTNIHSPQTKPDTDGSKGISSDRSLGHSKQDKTADIIGFKIDATPQRENAQDILDSCMEVYK